MTTTHANEAEVMPDNNDTDKSLELKMELSYDKLDSKEIQKPMYAYRYKHNDKSAYFQSKKNSKNSCNKLD